MEVAIALVLCGLTAFAVCFGDLLLDEKLAGDRDDRRNGALKGLFLAVVSTVLYLPQLGVGVLVQANQVIVFIQAIVWSFGASFYIIYRLHVSGLNGKPAWIYHWLNRFDERFDRSVEVGLSRRIRTEALNIAVRYAPEQVPDFIARAHLFFHNYFAERHDDAGLSALSNVWDVYVDDPSLELITLEGMIYHGYAKVKRPGVRKEFHRQFRPRGLLFRIRFLRRRKRIKNMIE